MVEIEPLEKGFRNIYDHAYCRGLKHADRLIEQMPERRFDGDETVYIDKNFVVEWIERLLKSYEDETEK
jgi:hypothetical protein